MLLLIGWDRSSAHGAVLAARAPLQLLRALRVYALPTAREPYGPLPEPRQRLKTDRADISLLVVVHRAGGRGGALRLSLGHQAGRVLRRSWEGSDLCGSEKSESRDGVVFDRLIQTVQDIMTVMFSFKNLGSYKSTNLAVSENDKQDIGKMAENVIPADLLALLRQVDTPTVCNAIEVAQGKRGFNRFTRGTMQHSKPGDPAMVGFARTAKALLVDV